MPETREYKVYKFEEASEDLKKKILDNYRTFEAEYWGWWQNVYYDFQEKMREIGVEIPEKGMSFSGFYSQGDGASFKPVIDDSNKFIDFLIGVNPEKASKLKKLYNMGAFSFGASRGRSYSSYDYWIVEIFYETDHKRINNIIQDLETEFEGWYKNACRELYRDLEAESEYLESDEYLSDIFISNEYYFTEDGKID